MSEVVKLKDTLNLPKTKFPMQAQLVKREPERLKYWEDSQLYTLIQKKNAGHERFVLHDGPPFTNGDVHIGTALNKILKDIILRYKSMQGFSTPYIPGWDCHGLPIEHKVSKEHPELLNDVVALRSVCDQFSESFIQRQEKQFRRLGIVADWEHAYKTKDPKYEADVLRTFARFVEAGVVYRSKKPVYWSIPCKTALAEAEIEYKDHVSTTVWVKFFIKDPAALGLSQPTAVVIWTTTPWTLPANRAIALSPSLEYVEIKTAQEAYLVAKGLADNFVKDCKIEAFSQGKVFLGSDLEGVKTKHPFINIESPIVLADYVTLDAGTGCVHTAPGHGIDDYNTGLRYKLEIACPVDDDGVFVDDGNMPKELVGKAVWMSKGDSPANDAVIELLKQKNALLNVAPYSHSYPHCWRSKSPVISRALPQWFIHLEVLKSKAKFAIDHVKWMPEWGKNRILGSVESRPDWCISRQRTWGIPMPVFFDGKGNALLDENVIRALADRIAEYGTQWWFENNEEVLLKGICLPKNWANKKLYKSKDTLDVWIDSGCSHVSVLESRDWEPADLYLEGSDQHRGWFQSSLFTALVDKDYAPYKSVLTHGFFVDENRRKISKSDGSPQTADAYTSKYGADILRLWVASEDYRNDIPVSENILQHVIATYRTLRNTLRFQLGNLFDFCEKEERVDYKDLLAIDRWVLHETNRLIKEVTQAYENYDFHKVYQSINGFCTLTLSARYHDILKDRLYTLRADGLERRSAQTVLFDVCSVLLKLLAPILTFTADEAWECMHVNSDLGYTKFIHLEDFPKCVEQWEDVDLSKDFEKLFKIREQVQLQLELARQEKIIGQSLDAKVLVSVGVQNEYYDVLKKYINELTEYFIVSAVHLSEDDGADMRVKVEHADGVRCPRTWRWVDKLVYVEGFGEVSERCAEVLQFWSPTL